MESKEKNNTIEIKIVPTDRNWKTYYTRQIGRIQTWWNNDFSAKMTLENIDDGKVEYQNEKLKEKAGDLIIDQFLSGKNIAGVGQGKFTKDTKSLIKKNWGEISGWLKKIKEKNDSKTELSGLINDIKSLQQYLINLCEKAGKTKEEPKTEEEEKKRKVSVPWASIHSIVVALLPNVFCSIVTDNNLDALYDLLKKIAPEKNENDGEDSMDEEIGSNNIDGKKITIDFNSYSWDNLVKDWKDANDKEKVKDANDKEKVKNNMSWYYKSAAVYKYFKSCCDNKDYIDWDYDYPWEVLSALRGSERINQLKDSLINQKNLILTGAPGTGKTYLAKQIASRIIFGDNAPDNNDKKNKLKESGQYEFVQFHPSYDYTDFVEGLRPVDGGTGNNVGFKRMDGVFKAFCAKAALVDKAEEEKDKKEKDKKKKDKKDRTKFVFVIDEINRGEISKIFGELFFSIEPGYRGECDEHNNDNRVKTQYQNLITPDEKFIIKDNKIIEKLGEATETTGDTTELEATKGFKYPFKEGFYVPENVCVIGTMNDIDRSVESMDFAFRRRFAFVEITAEDSSAIIYSAKEEDKGWNSDIKQSAVDRMNSLNKAIVTKCELAPQYQIGGAYFLKLEDVGFRFDRLWNEYLQGTLYEYFRGLPANEIKEKMKLLKDAYDNGVVDDN